MYRDTIPKEREHKQPYAAFGTATLGGQPLDPSTNAQNSPDDRALSNQQRPNTSSRNKRDGSFKLRCACGRYHSYDECYYINQSKAPENWKENPVIKARLINTIKGNQRHRRGIEALFGRKGIILPSWWTTSVEPVTETQTKRQQLTTAPTSEQANQANATVHAVYALNIDIEDQKVQNLFKLDTAATTHVTGDYTRFHTFQTADHPVRHGNTISRITGYGSVIIAVQTPDGQRMIQINNVAYVPGFHFNILSAGALEEKGLYHNARSGWIQDSAGQNLYKITKLDRLYALEQPKPGAAVFATEKTTLTSSSVKASSH
jgi:hypothetical protein